MDIGSMFLLLLTVHSIQSISEIGAGGDLLHVKKSYGTVNCQLSTESSV